jgi:hypothetical protein
MEKEDIKRAAEQAVSDLRLDCEITDITRPLGRDTWCIQFTGSYGQFCDEFHDKAGKENSARVVREKIKRFFLKQRKPARIVRGRSTASRRSRQGAGDLLSTLLSAGEQVIKQASRITGEVIERATNLNQAVLKTEAEWVEGVSPTAANLIRPDGEGSRPLTTEPPQREVEPVEVAPVSAATRKPAPRTVISRPKAVAKTELLATTKAPEDSHARPTKKRTAKKTARKSTAKKRSAKTARKKTGKKTSKKKQASKSQ